MKKRRLVILPFLAATMIIAAHGQTTRFAADVYPIFEKAGCEGCHNPNGVAAATRLHFPEQGAKPEEIEAFGASLAQLVDAQDPENSLLLNKPTNRIPHTGGRRIAPGSEQESALRAWVKHLAALPSAQTAGFQSSREEPSENSVLRRMTHSQYDNTARDLLGDISNPSREFP